MTSPAATPEARPDPYAAWRMRNYQLYTASWFLMTFAKQVESVAMVVYVYAVTGSALALGWLGLVQAVPVMALAIVGGQIADRHDRRMVIMVMVALNAVVSIGVAAACVFNASLLWIYLLLLVGAVGQSLGGPSRSALLPQIVPAEKFSNAITWSSSVFQIASMVGPAVGGLIVAAGGFLPAPLATIALCRVFVPAALGLSVMCRLLSLVAISGIPPRPPTEPTQSISVESLVAGLRFVWNQKPILATITLDLFAVLFGGATYLLPVFADKILGFGPSAVGYLRSAESAGAIVMAILLTHLPPIRRAGPTMLLAVTAFGVATIGFGLSRSFWLSFTMMFLIGAFDNISVVVRHTLVQMLTPDAMRGRVSAVNNVFIVASNDLGGLESGLTAWLFGPVISVVGGGIGTILVVLAAARKWPQILAIGSLKDLRPADVAEAEEQAEEEQAARG